MLFGVCGVMYIGGTCGELWYILYELWYIYIYI
jgi:hypothetical protein